MSHSFSVQIQLDIFFHKMFSERDSVGIATGHCDIFTTPEGLSPHSIDFDLTTVIPTQEPNTPQEVSPIEVSRLNCKYRIYDINHDFNVQSTAIPKELREYILGCLFRASKATTNVSPP